MKVAVIGASGRGGSRIVEELVRRGHTVTAIARNLEKLPTGPNITAKKGDAHEAGLADLLKGHDAVISAIRFAQSDPALLIGAVKTSGVKRYLVMGGAGSLEVAPGKKLIDTPQFPDAAKPEASKGGVFLDLLRQENALDWTFLSPAALIEIGERTGKFRVGGDRLLTDVNGKSRITFEDYAIAMVDEVENPKHTRKRFSVAY
ncbi:MAG: NAD(P)-dependent oxidoreductase [Pseudorhodoplanes sp.]